MSEGVPTQWEQDVAETYVNEHPLSRPNRNITTVALFLSMLIALSTVATWVLFSVAGSAKALSSPLHAVSDIRTHHPLLAVVCAYAAVFFLVVIACSKIIAVGVVQMYQHYAPEELRRRCRFRPTCSEYTILALRKYGVLIGLYKSIHRLNRCKGDIYRIDCP